MTAMLAELAGLGRSAADPAARRLGYAKAAVSLWSRRRRCARAWAEHQVNTRGFARRWAAAAGAHDTLWLLGAGTLADLPLAELSELFRRVVVFDIALLGGARRAAKRFATSSCNWPMSPAWSRRWLNGDAACRCRLRRPMPWKNSTQCRSTAYRR